jgi:hypothetical protein
MFNSKTTSEKFEENIQRTNGCWFWLGNKQFKLRVGKKNISAKKYSFELKYGPIPEGMKLQATCYNNVCVNPDHMDLIRPTFGMKI